MILQPFTSITHTLHNTHYIQKQINRNKHRYRAVRTTGMRHSPSSTAVPEKTLGAIQELKKDKIVSGGNMNKTAEDTSGDR